MPRNWVAQIAEHPGASLEQIQGEPDWRIRHNHRTGFKSHDGRRPGFTDELLREELEDEDVVEDAEKKFERLRRKANQNKLINFRDLVHGIKDFHLVHPDLRPSGWRYVLESTEDWIKYGQDWPCNLRRQEQQEQKQGDNAEGDEQNTETESSADGSSSDDDQEKLDGDESTSNLATLLKRERKYIDGLESNDGLGKSPQAAARVDLTIDEADQFTPDNWFPRSPELIRVTGSHPVNAESPLTELFTAGLITPNYLHYVRNHGPVPRLHWEFHKLEVLHQNNKHVFSMEDLTTKFYAINIPVFMACDGNRRKELNQIKRSKGFNFGPGAGGCAYWKGVLLRDVLLDAGIDDPLSVQGRRKTNVPRWVNFEGSDDLPEGKYSTCIDLEYAMDPRNDVLLAFQMNDKPLPPDHGYPLRLIIPGYVGGRCVKWLKRIWTSDKENDSYYHIWDNRVLPSFVTDHNAELAEELFRHRSTACNEQILNSVITRPEQGERIPLSTDPAETYRLRGIAFNGGGRIVQRVEASVDGGRSWLYCFRKFPKRPIRHTDKFWTWIHWHVEVPILDLMNAKEIAVRCLDVSNNMQPSELTWNVMGMMNNAYYKVQLEITKSDNENGVGTLLCRHPVEPGSGDGGWMRPSIENTIEQKKLEARVGSTGKRFTREEIEKHDEENDCWIVVDKGVYDATSVLSWHPGGSGIILAHAGRVHPKTTEEFNSIHDSYAWEKLNECMIGTVTDKVAKFLDQLKADEEQAKKASSNNTNQALQEHRWTKVKLIKREEVSPDTRSYTFQLPEGKNVLGLNNGRHIEMGFHMQDKMLIRPYTPTLPILPPLQANGSCNSTSSEELHDGKGTFDLTIKTYFPSQDEPGGAMSNILDTIPINEEVDIRGPKGEIIYSGHGQLSIEGKARNVKYISFVMGGTGITPGYSIISRIVHTGDDNTQIRVLDANNTENDILLKDEFDYFEKHSDGKVKVAHVLAKPDESWGGLKGFVTRDMMQEHLFPPGKDSIVLVCGPPAMITKAVLPGLKELGYVEDENIFGF